MTLPTETLYLYDASATPIWTLRLNQIYLARHLHLTHPSCQLCYSRPSVELFLNLAWAALSILLVGGWIWSIREGHTEFQWTTCVALVLLLVLLFPAISMTDDRVAMSTPVELEHMMRASEAPHGQLAIIGLFGLLAAIVLVILNLASPLFYSRMRPRVFAETLLAGLIRAVGVRPPPVSGLFAH